MRGHMWLNKVASVLGPYSGSKFRVIFAFSANLGGKPVSCRITYILLFDSYLICYKTIPI